MSERCPEGVWYDRISVCCFDTLRKLSEGLLSMSGICLEGVWNVAGMPGLALFYPIDPV